MIPATLFGGHHFLSVSNYSPDGHERTLTPSTRLIQEHWPFFEQQAGISKVRVLGHSLSTVDAPYFKALLTVPGVSDAQWQVAYRACGEGQQKFMALQGLGVKASNIITLPWSEV